MRPRPGTAGRGGEVACWAAWIGALALALVGALQVALAAPPTAGPWQVEPLPLAEGLWRWPLPPQTSPRGAQVAERALAAALRRALLPAGAAVQLGCADRQLWVRVQVHDPAAVDQAAPAVQAALTRAARAKPRGAGQLSLSEIEAMISDLDDLRLARGVPPTPTPTPAWVGGGAFAVQVDGLPLLRIRLLVGGLGPLDAPGGAAARAAALRGGGPEGLAAALRDAGVGAWERGADARADGLLRLWADVLPAQAPVAVRALEEAAARVIAAPSGPAPAAWASVPAPSAWVVEQRPSRGQRLLLIGDLDAAPVEMRVHPDWPSERPRPAALDRRLGSVGGLGCGGHAPTLRGGRSGAAAG
ncbi:MAG: hypothetical protein JNM72_06245 [Deltaproteobacteria bacterium]|nr:hypothetical protein [Deltaproteobacteria bacterium]